MKPSRKILGTLAILPFLLAFQSCHSHENENCAGIKTQALAEEAARTLDFSVKLSKNRKTNEFEPRILSFEESETYLVKHVHLSTGAKVQLLSAKQEVLYEDNIPNLLTASFDLTHEVKKNGNAIQLAELERHLEDIRSVVSVPRLNEATNVRIVIERKGTELETLAPLVVEEKIAALAKVNAVADAFRELKASGAVLEPVYVTGQIKNRLNIIVMADGYRKNELDQFRAETEALRDHFLKLVPYDKYQGFYNIWRLVVPSADSGADCDDDKLSPRDTVFGTIFPVACLNAIFGTKFNDRFIVQRKPMYVRAAQKFLQANGRDVQSEAFVLSNSPKYGGTAIVWASMNNRCDPEVFTHELGHSFGGLADEYVVEGDPCMFFNLFKPNVSLKKKSADKVKWARWIESGTPIPTPDTDQYEGKIGLFKGASDCKSLFYRPARMCKMNSNEGDFCAVCREQTLLRLYDYVRPFDTGIRITGIEGSHHVFADAKLTNENVEVHWELDGEEVSAGQGYFPLEVDLKPGKHRIGLRVWDKNPSLRKDRCHASGRTEVEVSI